MTTPWMKFYPADWRSDPKLRLCSMAARGLWIELLCIMHEAEPRGFLVSNGSQLSDKQLAALVGTTTRELNALLNELEAAGVFSRDENGTIYSRRVVRDAEKQVRDKENGRKGGNPNLRRGVNPKANPQVNVEDKAQKPEARSQNYPSQDETYGGLVYSLARDDRDLGRSRRVGGTRAFGEVPHEA
jgi:hypothetical protein